MNAISVGRVSTRKNARTHLALGNLAHCGAGTGRISGPSRTLAADAVATLCGRCVHAIRARVQEAIHAVMRRRDTAALRLLNKIADALRTPAEVKAEEKTLAEIETAIKTTPSGRRPRTFADLRLMHIQAIERDKAERGQLELCEVTA
jgi:hypothetical protein